MLHFDCMLLRVCDFALTKWQILLFFFLMSRNIFGFGLELLHDLKKRIIIPTLISSMSRFHWRPLQSAMKDYSQERCWRKMLRWQVRKCVDTCVFQMLNVHKKLFLILIRVRLMKIWKRVPNSNQNLLIANIMPVDVPC